MKIEPAPRARRHTVYRLADGTKIPSVTGILREITKGDHLIRWANNLGLEGYDSVEYVKAQAAVGTLGHAMVQAELRNEPADFRDYSPEEISRAKNVLRSFRAWREGHTLRPILIEASLVSETHRFGGTIDLYAELDDQPVLIDLKSSSDIYDTHLYQIAAYRVLLEEAGYPVARAGIVMLPRSDDANFKSEWLVDSSHEWQVFQAAQEVYLAQARRAARKNDIPVSSAVKRSVRIHVGGDAKRKEEK